MTSSLNGLKRSLVIVIAATLVACGGGGSDASFIPFIPSTPVPTQAGVTITDNAQGAAPPTRVVATYSASISAVGADFFAVGGNCTRPPTSSTALDSSGMVATVRLNGGDCEAGQTLSLILDPAKVTLDNATLGNAEVWTRSYTIVPTSQRIGGSVSGLAGTLVLQNNGGETLTTGTDGAFTFATPVQSGDAYAMTVIAQPTGQTCSVSHGSGIVGTNPIDNVTVVCATNAYAVGGTVSGLVGAVVLQDNGGDALTINADGSFAFPTPVAYGAGYAVTVQTQPASQTCSVASATGTMGGANVTNVLVTCSTNAFTVGGTITGLASGMVLQNNGGDNLTLNANGSFTFPTPVAAGSTYNVTVLTQPIGATCTVTNGSGTIGGANVTNVAVTCALDSAMLSLTPGTILIPVNGGSIAITVTNAVGSLSSAHNVQAILPGGWAEVTQDASQCVVLPPGASCNLSFSSTASYAGPTIVSIQGDNTNTLSLTVAF
jgi:hypothetical protein